MKEQVEVNENRKRKLLKVVDQQLQYEQYQQVLDTFDQQVEQSYVKRFVSTQIPSIYLYSVLTEDVSYQSGRKKSRNENQHQHQNHLFQSM